MVNGTESYKWISIFVVVVGFFAGFSDGNGRDT